MVSITRILCPVDFSDYSRHALDHAVAIARWYHASVSVLHVHRLTTPIFAAAPTTMPPTFVPASLTEEEVSQLMASLDAYVSADRAAGIPVDTLLDEAFDVGDAILARADSLRPDLLALGTHGRSGFQRFMLGSVTEKVLRKAVCPVLTVPPRASDDRPVSMRPRVLCAIDFSKASARALDYAASLADETDGVLTVLHVVDVPAESDDPSLPDLREYRAARVERAERRLAESVAVLGEQWKVSPIVVSGTPYKEILRLAGEQHADLIVMGVHGRGAVDLALFGSTTQHVVRQAECPVLTLRSDAHD